MSGGSTFISLGNGTAAPTATVNAGAPAHANGASKGTRLATLLNAQQAPAQQQPTTTTVKTVVTTNNAPATAAPPATVDKSNLVTLKVDVEHAWTSAQATNPIAKPAIKQALKKLGFPDGTQVHVAEVRVSKTNNPTEVPLNVSHIGLAGVDSVASNNRFDGKGDPITSKVLPKAQFVPPGHQKIYVNPLRGNIDLLATHSDITVPQMKAALTDPPDSDHQLIWAKTNQKLIDMLKKNKARIPFSEVGGPAPHIVISKEALETFFADYDKNVQSNFVRVDPDSLSIELQNPGAHKDFGKSVAEAHTHQSDRDAFSNPKAKPVVTQVLEYDVYPLPPATGGN